jgi:hypothetical protein
MKTAVKTKKTEKTFEAAVTIEVPFESLRTAIISALDGLTYSCVFKYVKTTKPRVKAFQAAQYPSYEACLYPGGSVTLWCEEEKKNFTLDLEAIHRGVAALAKDDVATFLTLVEGDADKIDIPWALAFLEYCLFGQVIY